MTELRPAFVATTGGHLVELDVLAPLLEPNRFRDALWVTHDKPQSRSLLAGRDVLYTPFLHARGWGAVLAATPRLAWQLHRRGVDRMYSTGGVIALATLPGGGLRRSRPTYIESIARADRPSATGTVLARLPWVQVQTQYPHLATGRWTFQQSLLDAFSPTAPQSMPVRRIFVTLGTARPWRFDRLVEAVGRITPPAVEIVWQTGCTQVDGLPGEVHEELDERTFRQLVSTSDVVISHAGAGSLLSCLQEGRRPVLVPRRHTFGEHVDDHQSELATQAGDRGLAVSVDANELRWEDVTRAASQCVRRAS